MSGEGRDAGKTMRTGLRIAAAAAAGLAVGVAVMLHDRSRGAEWAVTPEQVADAKAAGKPGVEIRPGTIAVLPIRSETADQLPFKWLLLGLGTACVVLAGTGIRRASETRRRS